MGMNKLTEKMKMNFKLSEASNALWGVKELNKY